MKRKTLAIAIACGIACMLCVLAYTASVRMEAESARDDAVSRYGGEQVEVVVAKSDILPGETLGAGNVETRSWLVDLLPEDCVTSTGEAFGRQTASFIAKGEVVVKKRFENSSKTVEVPDGMVALSVPAEEVAAVGGAVRAGSRVDVYAVGNSTTKLGSGLLVLATSGGEDASGAQAVEWITLALTPGRVQEYVSASETMQLYFALPSTSEDEGQGQSDVELRDGKKEA